MKNIFLLFSPSIRGDRIDDCAKLFFDLKHETEEENRRRGVGGDVTGQ